VEVLLTIVLLVVIFGILIGIHEFGHYIAAKKCGVWVQEFAFGFGPNLYKKKSGNTIYKVNLIPLGGYVKLFGERRLSKDASFMKKFEKLDNKKEDSIINLAKKYELDKVKDEYKLFDKVNGLKDLGDKDKELLLEYELNQDYRINDSKRYSNKTIAQRALIISAGVIMNFILGIIIYSIYLLLVNQRVLLFDMAPSNFPGATVTNLEAPIFVDQENLQNSEIDYINAPISKIDGEYVLDLEDFVKKLENIEVAPITIEYYKNGKFKQGILDKKILNKYPELNNLLEYSGKLAIGEIVDNTPASIGGLKNNIVLLKLAGQEVDNYNTFTSILEQNQSNNVDIEYYDLEEKKIVNQQIKLGNKSEGLIFGATGFYEYFPFMYLPAYMLDYSDSNIISGVLHSYNITNYQFQVFKNIIKYSFENKDTSLLSETVGGPIRIGNEIGTLVKLGNFTDILNLMALISLSLGVMNLLPIPIVDGGHLLFLFIEKIKGSPLSEGVQGFFNMLGLVFIILLSLVVTLKDILSLIFK
jgi:regulator of sigma E protease